MVEKWFLRLFKVWVLAVALLSIPQFLRGDFLIELSLGGIMFAVNQWLCFVLVPLIFFDFIKSLSNTPTSINEEAEVDG